jgi:Subtilase family
MYDLEPLDEKAPQVDIADQIIVGFTEKLRAFDRATIEEKIGIALASLGDPPPTVLRRFVEASPDKRAFFAFVLIRLNDPDVTLADLQNRLARKDRQLADVAWFERNAPVTPASFPDPLSGQQWALATLGASDPWTVTPPAGSRTLVAIVDSGVRRPDGTLHADLGSVEPGGGIDMDGHGTFLAGTIAAKPGNGQGVASAVPVSWNISLLSAQFFTPRVPPNAFDAALAIAFAALCQAKVINASWHVAPGDQGLAILRYVVNAAKAHSLVVMAAGNDGTDNEIYPTYPANFGAEAQFQGRVLTVLATDRYDGKASFSNYGKNIVDLGAPGLRILTTARYLVDPPRYAEYSGTSAAAAYASAGAALVFALNPGWTPQQVIQHLTASADTIQDLKLACIGGKRLNLGRAVYGPLHITAPLAGVTLSRSATNPITWSNDYANPGLSVVKIEFSTDNFATPPKILALTWSIGAGAFPSLPGMLTLTTTGRIRIAPTQGNFPVVSGPFTVVA